MQKTDLAARGLHRLTYNAVVNGIGQILPMLLGIISVPPLLKGLGVERFGLLTLAWTVVGVSNLFDLGLGRAITQSVSSALAQGRRDEVSEIVGTGFLSIFLFGMVGGLLLWIGAEPLASRFKAGGLPSAEGVFAIRAVAIGLPAVTLMSGVRAFLESMGEFKYINLHRILVGIGTFLGPLVIIRWSNHVAIHVTALVIVRVISLVFQFRYAKKLGALQNIVKKCQWKRFATLLRYGGWMTISNMISPLMVYMDRFFIGSIVGLGAVSYYATPVDLLTRTLVIPNALVSALFPLVTDQLHRPDGNVERLFSKSVLFISVIMLPSAIVGGLFASSLLTMWMGAEFADKAHVIFRILIVGVLANGFSSIPYALLQAAGRPDITAKIHMLELPIYLVSLCAFSRVWGLSGAAAAWSLRLLLDAILLFCLWKRVSRSRLCPISAPC